MWGVVPPIPGRLQLPLLLPSVYLKWYDGQGMLCVGGMHWVATYMQGPLQHAPISRISKATAMGFTMTLLDLGGGFSKGLTKSFTAVTDAINAALDQHFPPGRGVRIIAEPGRYFAESAAALAVVVNGVREQLRVAAGAFVCGVVFFLWGVCIHQCHLPTICKHTV